MDDEKRTTAEGGEQDVPETETETDELAWNPPESSDQAPGEETVQVNDAYRGGGPPPENEPSRDDDQHRTGG